jgi:hypothetical protein
MNEQQERVVEIIVRWALALPRPPGRSRINRRLLFGNEAIARAVGARLSTNSTEEHAWMVRSSTDRDAVRLRNDREDGVSPDAALIYLVFWLPGHPGHEKNFESLRDLPPVTLADFLDRSTEFLLPDEEAIAKQCAQAAEAWSDRSRARAQEHLAAAWNALRKCLRERRGGNERSIPFIDDISNYLAWLEAARISDEEWERIPVKDRAAAMVSRWGEALPQLSMFHLPAFAHVVGVTVDPTQAIPSPSRTGEEKWVGLIEEILALNKEAATDFPGLEEDIAGKQTLRERLDDLTTRIPLCSNPASRPASREALERFCQSGDATAFSEVEWLFLQGRTDRRSPSQGLRGLLIARKLRAPRPNPLDRLTNETIELFERLAGAAARDSDFARQYVLDLRNRAARDRHEALAIAENLRALAGGTLPPSVTGTPAAPMLSKVLDAPDRDPQDLERLARGWEKHGRPDADVPVPTDSLLLGLVQLSYARMEQAAEGDRYRLVANNEVPGELVLSVQIEGRRVEHRTPVGDWSIERRTAIQCWLRDHVRPLVFDEDTLDEDDDEEAVAITVDVERMQEHTRTAFGTVVLTVSPRTAALLRASRSDTLISSRREGVLPANNLLSGLFESSDAEKIPEDPDHEELRKAWQNWVRALGIDNGWADIASVAPLPMAARNWVEAWTRSLEQVGTGSAGQQELQEIRAQIDAETDPNEIRQLAMRMATLAQTQPTGPNISLNDVRKLLRLCTGTTTEGGQSRQLVLTPHHPLVLRLRLVADDILAETLQLLWTKGWDRRTLDDLEGAMNDWGLPEPIHCYGSWEGDPLAFEDWFDQGFALFSPLGVGREIDSLHIGARQVAVELEKYASLFPAAADRMLARLRGDRKGVWAWHVLEDRMRTPPFSADIQLVTDLPHRQPTHIDSLVQREELLSHLFEPGTDGSLPRLRIRREYPKSTSVKTAHVTAIVGDLVEELRSTITLMTAPTEAAPYALFDQRVFFYEPVPELLDYSLLIGDPADRLSVAVSKAVAVAASHPGQVFRERFAFDATKCSFQLKRLQEEGHWLVLTSRQPLYRAVQQSGTSALLDFYSAVERGRPVHVCVSLDAQQADKEIGRLQILLKSLLRESVSRDEARGVLLTARSLAPGLAMRCIGSTGSVSLSGLIGLLLSARACQGDLSDSLLLSLDQHRDLLSGAGRLSDLLRIGLNGSTVQIDVVEAKFSTGNLAIDAAPIQEARHQVQSTIQRLAQFTLEHPLVLRTRARLARAVVHRIHLGTPDPARATRWKELIDKVLDPAVPIVVGNAGLGSVHAWSIEGSTKDAQFDLPGGERIYIHGRSQTLNALRGMSADCAAELNR